MLYFTWFIQATILTTTYEVTPTLTTKVNTLQHPKIVLPRCGKHRTMDFFHIEDPSQLQRGTLGILEPDPNFSTKVSPQDIDAILCPGWGFTLTGARLGKGGGYYDRYLSQTTAIRIGVGYECQVLTKIPTELHDLSMDLLVTDQGVHSLKKS